MSFGDGDPGCCAGGCTGCGFVVLVIIVAITLGPVGILALFGILAFIGLFCKG